MHTDTATSTRFHRGFGTVPIVKLQGNTQIWGLDFAACTHSQLFALHLLSHDLNASCYEDDFEVAFLKNPLIASATLAPSIFKVLEM